MNGKDSEKESPSEHLRTGSDKLVGGVSDVNSGIRYIVLSGWEWFGNHPIIKWFVLLPIGWFLTNQLLEIMNFVYIFFFGTVTPIGGDVSVTTTALPLGLSVNLLFFLWVVTVSVATARIVQLRQRVEQLEDNQ